MIFIFLLLSFHWCNFSKGETRLEELFFLGALEDSLESVELEELTAGPEKKGRHPV
jgi:hypothetical protein